jgi:hypothetical protein
MTAKLVDQRRERPYFAEIWGFATLGPRSAARAWRRGPCGAGRGALLCGRDFRSRGGARSCGNEWQFKLAA